MIILNENMPKRKFSKYAYVSESDEDDVIGEDEKEEPRKEEKPSKRSRISVSTSSSSSSSSSSSAIITSSSSSSSSKQAHTDKDTEEEEEEEKVVTVNIEIGELSFSFLSQHKHWCPNRGKQFTFYDDYNDGRLEIFSRGGGSRCVRHEGCCPKLILCDWRYNFVLETTNRHDHNAIAVYPAREGCPHLVFNF